MIRLTEISSLLAIVQDPVHQQFTGPTQKLIMSTNEQTPLSQPTSSVQNTLGKEQIPQDLGRPAFDAALQEYCDRNPSAFTNFNRKKTPSRKKDLKKRLGSGQVRSMTESPEPRHGRSESPRKKDSERRMVFKRLEKGVFHRLGDKGKSMYAYSNDSRRMSYHSSRGDTEKAATRVLAQEKQSLLLKNVITKEHPHEGWKRCQKVKILQEDTRSQNQSGRSRALRMIYPNRRYVKKQTLFTLRIRYFDFPKTRIPSHIKTYDGSEDPEDHLKIFQAAAKTERWAMPTWCHMFNSTLTGNARVCRKNASKIRLKIHNIKQRYGESTEEFVRRYKLECMDMKGAPECMKILGFMYSITNLELIKRLHDKISKSVDEMMRVATTFLRGEVAASSCERKKSLMSWKQQEAGQKQNFKKGGFRNQQSKAMRKTMQRQQKRGNLRKEQATGNTDEEDGTKGPMIIEADMGGHFVHRMYVNKGSSSKIMYEHCFNRFRPEVRSQMVPTTTPLVRFSREIIWLLGKISLLVKIGDDEHLTFTWMNFMVVRSPSPYNGIIERPGVRRIQAVPSTTHEMIKFPVIGRTVTLRSSRIIPLM
nr:reverse transcriptase domain-containing protein [Tanacetum cinerariifolium]